MVRLVGSARALNTSTPDDRQVATCLSRSAGGESPYMGTTVETSRQLCHWRPILRGMTAIRAQPTTRLRVGQAAEMLQVSVETLRRWETEGRITTTRSSGGQRMVPIAEITRLLAERRSQAIDRASGGASARNRFPGIVTRIEKDRVA